MKIFPNDNLFYVVRALLSVAVIILLAIAIFQIGMSHVHVLGFVRAYSADPMDATRMATSEDFETIIDLYGRAASYIVAAGGMELAALGLLIVETVILKRAEKRK